MRFVRLRLVWVSIVVLAAFLMLVGCMVRAGGESDVIPQPTPVRSVIP